MTLRTTLLGTLIVALVHTGVLVKFIYDRAQALQSGQEVVVESGFIDPRDLFRGHYTRLNLEISRIEKSQVEILGSFKRNDPVYVELDTSTPFAKPVRLSKIPFESPKGPVLKGKSRSNSTRDTEKTIRITFPFNRFYADKTRALELENMQRNQQLGVILSVTPDGTAMIKGLTLKGEKIYEEAVY